jgi:RNA polymerase-binding transcription factor DksA
MAKVKEKEKDKDKAKAKPALKAVAKAPVKAPAPAAKPAAAAPKPAASKPAAPAAKAPAKAAAPSKPSAPAKPVTDSFRASAATPASKSAASAKAPSKPTTTVIKAASAAKAVSESAKAPAAKVPAAKAANEALKPKTEAKLAKPATDSIKKPAPAGKSASATAKVNGSAGDVEVSKSSGKNGASAAAKAAKVPEKEKFNPMSLKCPFPNDELSKWREMLIMRRSELSNDIAGLVKDAMEAEDGHTTPNHIAERGSDADLQDMSLGMVGEEENILWQIDRAIRKIDKSSPLPYGLCEYTKEPIPKSRLQLIPWTPLSIEGATHLEQSNMTLEDLLLED